MLRRAWHSWTRPPRRGKKVRRAVLRTAAGQGDHPSGSGGGGEKAVVLRVVNGGAGDADGSVGGAVNSTAETVRAALHAVGVHPRARLVSSVFIMALQDRSLGHKGLIAFADCAVVIDPDAMQMADIAIATAESTRVLIDAEPAVALLSFSTKGSGKQQKVDKVVEAMEICGRARRS